MANEMTLLIAATLALAPMHTFDANWLLHRAQKRRIERLQIEEQMINENRYVRIGRTIQTQTASPRRTRFAHEAKVTDVIDGSLIRVLHIDGREQTVHILGAEAPLIRKGSKKAQCFALQAKEFLSRSIIDQTVALEQSDDFGKDNDGRVLHYVRLGGRDVGSWMISSGYAFSDRNNAHERQSLYHTLEDEAKDLEIGLWSGICDYTLDPRRVIRVLE